MGEKGLEAGLYILQIKCASFIHWCWNIHVRERNIFWNHPSASQILLKTKDNNQQAEEENWCLIWRGCIQGNPHHCCVSVSSFHEWAALFVSPAVSKVTTTCWLPECVWEVEGGGGKEGGSEERGGYLPLYFFQRSVLNSELLQDSKCAASPGRSYWHSHHCKSFLNRRNIFIT